VRVGAQAVALGDHKFRLVGYRGGLPGKGYDQERAPVHGEATMADGKAQYVFETHNATLHSDGTITVYDKGSGEKVGSLKRIDRTSPTLGAKPPAGAVVLFDGTKQTLEKNWKPGARITDDGLLEQGATSIPTFGDHKLHIEFRLPYQPHARGQGRGNSGVYLQGRHEVQMLDSFGLEGRDNECGGIYSVAGPSVNMCLPPLSWQTYDIEVTAAKYDDAGNKTANARMTVYHNGVKVHDNVEVPKATTAAPVGEGPQPGPVYLQNHGNPVRYRNVWVVGK
jgi:hypothetical protein